MGYTTTFHGRVYIDPPLNHDEHDFLLEFAGTRRMDRDKGPLYVKGDGFMGQANDDDVRNHNKPDADQPGLWCQWVPTDECNALEWDEGEKFYEAAEWMKYLVENLLAPSARQYIDDHIDEDPRLKSFTCNHKVNGQIEAQGEDSGDRWMLVVTDNVVGVAETEVTFKNVNPV